MMGAWSSVYWGALWPCGRVEPACPIYSACMIQHTPVIYCTRTVIVTTGFLNSCPEQVSRTGIQNNVCSSQLSNVCSSQLSNVCSSQLSNVCSSQLSNVCSSQLSNVCSSQLSNVCSSQLSNVCSSQLSNVCSSQAMSAVNHPSNYK